MGAQFLSHYLTILDIKTIFSKHFIINGFHTHNFLTSIKRFLSNVCKTKKILLGYYQVFTPIYSSYLPVSFLSILIKC